MRRALRITIEKLIRGRAEGPIVGREARPLGAHDHRELARRQASMCCSRNADLHHKKRAQRIVEHAELVRLELTDLAGGPGSDQIMVRLQVEPELRGGSERSGE